MVIVEAWQSRVIEEKKDLDAKIHALGLFLGRPDRPALSLADSQLLYEQREIMRQYSVILGQRIDLFNLPHPEQRFG